jgi:hypothetical protein
MQYRLIPLLICLLPLAPNLCAQTGQTERTPSTGSITLTVTDLTGGIVPNAEVDIDPSPKGLPNLKTNKDGMLSLDLPPGMYDLTVKSPGFHTETKHVYVDAGSRETISIALNVGMYSGPAVTPVPLSSPKDLGIARDLKIRVLDGRNGHPVYNICLNLSLGIWHGADLLAPTNADGLVVLHLEADLVSAEVPPNSRCVGGFPTEAVLPKAEDRITPASRGNDCHPKRHPPTPPSYSIREILEHGVVGENVCRKVRVEARPGELIFFVRPTPWNVLPFL